jgi:L-lactate dehydrogenase complex protein LldG
MSTSSRDQILFTIRKHLPESASLPELDGPWIEFSDPVQKFAEVLAMIGGTCVQVDDSARLGQAVASLPFLTPTSPILSFVPEVSGNSQPIAEVTEPHQLEHIELAILPGEIAVAENAAVWVTDRAVPHRVAYFLCQHLALVVPRSAVVHNLHQAYQQIRFDEPYFGGFIAGPSKTADIEQSLVIGAHGPRSMTVFLVG